MPATPAELDALAVRANLVAAGFGYSYCSVRSYNPPILAFQCADRIAAEAVVANFQVQGVLNVGIDPGDLSVVLRRL